MKPQDTRHDKSAKSAVLIYRERERKKEWFRNQNDIKTAIAMLEAGQ